MATLYTSEAGVYGRHVIVRTTEERCRFCGKRIAIEVDTSDEEYQTFVCCSPCFDKLCSGEVLE